MTALASERVRRDMPDRPRRLAPNPTLWRPGYARVAGDVPELAETTLDQALELTHAFIDPVLSEERTREVWEPHALTWQRPTPRQTAAP